MAYSTTIAQIAALYAEQQALWAKAGRLTEAEQGRLIDIRHQLERLWNCRRQEKAGAKGVAYALRRQARAAYRRRVPRGRVAGAAPPQTR